MAALPGGDRVIGAYLADLVWWIEGPRSALRTYEEVIAGSERRGLIPEVIHSRASVLPIRYDLGEWDRLLDEGHQIITSDEDGKHSAAEIMAMPYIAHVLAWRQQAEEAHTLCLRLLPRARDVADLQSLVPALAVSAHLARMSGDHKAAIDLIEELDQVTRHSTPWRSRHLPTALRVLIAAGEVEKAKRFASGIEVTATSDCTCVLTGQAILAEAKGQIEQARNLYQQAAQRWADYGFVLEEGQAHLGLGRCLIALAEREASTEPLQKARTIFSELGARSLLDEVDRHLGEATAVSS
jgi:tetratricopeptide (TPR) repeat protein